MPRLSLSRCSARFAALHATIYTHTRGDRFAFLLWLLYRIVYNSLRRQLLTATYMYYICARTLLQPSIYVVAIGISNGKKLRLARRVYVYIRMSEREREKNAFDGKKHFFANFCWLESSRVLGYFNIDD